MSAFLSALRSIGFVLQSDLKGRFGERFNDWWEEKKASLPTAIVPFSVIVELRNQALKAGELLPAMKVVVRVDHPAVEEVVLTFNTGGGWIAISGEEYKFRMSGAPTVQLPDLEDSQALFDQLVPALKPVFDSLNQDERPLEVVEVQYHLQHSAPAVSFDEMVGGFAHHIQVMHDIIANADQVLREEEGGS